MKPPQQRMGVMQIVTSRSWNSRVNKGSTPSPEKFRTCVTSGDHYPTRTMRSGQGMSRASSEISDEPSSEQRCRGRPKKSSTELHAALNRHTRNMAIPDSRMYATQMMTTFKSSSACRVLTAHHPVSCLGLYLRREMQK